MRETGAAEELFQDIINGSGLLTAYEPHRLSQKGGNSAVLKKLSCWFCRLLGCLLSVCQGMSTKLCLPFGFSPASLASDASFWLSFMQTTVTHLDLSTGNL